MMDFIVKLVQEESHWIIQLLLVVVAFLLLQFGFKQVLKRLERRFKESQTHWKHSFIQAIKPPLIALIWIIAIAIIANLIFQHFRPENPQNIIKEVYSLAILCCLTWFLLRWTSRIQLFLLQEQKLHGHVLEKSKIDVIAKLAYLLIWSFAIILGLDILGFNIATLVTIGGISGFSLGFASKDVIANFFGGFMIYMTRPFVVGDFIIAQERKIEGTVEQISWYYTLIRGGDKQPSYVPNSLFSTIVVVNRSRRTHWTFEENIGIRYKDIDALPLIVEEIRSFFQTSSFFDATQPIRVHLEKFADSSVNISILACTFATGPDEVADIRHHCLVTIASIIEKHNASFAFPTTTVEIPAGITIHTSDSNP